jgi:hypothetical protein
LAHRRPAPIEPAVWAAIAIAVILAAKLRAALVWL